MYFLVKGLDTKFVYFEEFRIILPLTLAPCVMSSYKEQDKSLVSHL